VVRWVGMYSMVMRSWTVRTVAKTETRTVRRKSLNRIIPHYRQEPLKLTFPQKVLKTREN